MPPLPVDESTEQAGENCVVITFPGGKEGAGEGSIWDDEDTRSFYEDLPKLKELVPAVLFETSKKGKEEGRDEDGEKGGEKGKQSEGKEEDKKGEDKTALNAESDAADKEERGDEGADTDLITDADLPIGESDDGKGKAPTPATLTPTDELLGRLSVCDNRELIDGLALHFCYVNSKSARKKLVQALFDVPKNSLNLIPFYARLVASIDVLMKDIAASLLVLLQREFRILLRKPASTGIETPRIRNVIFLGELCKFGICPTSVVFRCLSDCLDSFANFNIDVGTATLLKVHACTFNVTTCTFDFFSFCFQALLLFVLARPSISFF